MNTSVKAYLSAYNAIAFVAWGVFFAYSVYNKFNLNSTGVLLLNIAQGLAVLEIIHALLKWVKSPIGSTSAQVASRIFVVVILNFIYDQLPLHTITIVGIAIVSIAWSTTELIRYSYYFLLLQKREPATLQWMRYSFFILLYPLGVTGEWFIFVTPILKSGVTFDVYTVIILFTLIAYLYYFPVLYGYMWKQRRKKLL